MYSYSVELVGLQSTDYSATGVRTVDGDEYARFYDPPSVMFPKTTPHKAKKKKNHCLELYALEERKILTEKEASYLQLKPIKGENEGRRKRFQFDKEEQKKFIERYFSNVSCPNFICNLSTLKMLMIQHVDFKLIATKFRLDSGENYVYLKYLNFIQEAPYTSVGYLVEDVLATNSVEHSHVLEAIYHGTLMQSDENGYKGFRVGFIAETDGIWNTAKRSTANAKYDANDLAEVKSGGTAKFYWPRKKTFRPRRRGHKLNHYYYEEDVLRRYWAQCRLRGIEKLLCAVVQGPKQNEVMKEIWMYDVNRIPGLLQKENKNARPFPKVGFNDMDILDQEKFAELHQTLNWKEWSEETEFQKLFASLNQINTFLLEEDWSQTRYFVFKKEFSHRLLQPVTKDEFDRLSKHSRT